MVYLSKKIRTIYLPFLAVSSACIALYTLLNWLLVIRGRLIAPDEEILEIWIPMALAGAVGFLWSRPRMKLLKLDRARGSVDVAGLISLAMTAAVGVPLVIAQSYLATATGGVTRVARAGEIALRPPTKYYFIKEVSVDKGRSSSSSRLILQGKHSETLEMNLYVASPIADAGAAGDKASEFWMGKVYTYRINTPNSDEDRQEQFKSFLESRWREYTAADLRSFTYLERTGNNEDGRGLGAALDRNPHHEPGAPTTILVAHNDDFEGRNGNKPLWLLGSLGIGWVVMLGIVFLAPADRYEMDRYLRGEKQPPPKDKGGFSLLVPNKILFATPVLIDVNLAVFVVMALCGLGVVSVSSRDLLAAGANFQPAVAQGQVWRLFTSMFIHAGLGHLAGNMVGLLLAGLFLEPRIGRTRFAACYILSGLAASIASVRWHEATVSVGASGAVFGLMAAALVLALFDRPRKPGAGKSILMPIVYFIGFNLVMGLVSRTTDNAAHIGGGVFGLLFGGFFSLYPEFLPRKAPPDPGSDQYSPEP